MTEVADLFVTLRGVSSDFSASMDKAGASAAAADGKISALKASVGKMGLAVGAAAVAVGVVAVKMADNYQTQLTRLYTAAGGVKSEVLASSGTILALATSVGQTGTAMAEALYHPISAGLDLATSLQVVKYAAQEAAISGANLDDTTYSLSSVMKAFAVPAAQTGQTMAQLNAIVGDGDMRFQDFNQSIKNWTPTAAAMGISIQSMGASLAYLTDRAMPADVASTRLTMGLTMMTTPSKKAATLLEGLGLASSDVTASSALMTTALQAAGVTTSQLAADLKKPDGVYVALTDLQDKLKASGMSAAEAQSTMSKIFGGGRSDKAIMSLMQNLDQLKQKYDQIGTDSTAQKFAQDWADARGTFAIQLGMFKAAIENGLLIPLGLKLIPIVEQVMGWFSGVIGWFERGSRAAHDVGDVVGVFLVGALAVAGAALAAIGIDLAATVAPFALIALAIGGVAVGLYELYKKNAGFASFINGIASGVKGFVSDLSSGFQGKGILTGLNGVGDTAWKVGAKLRDFADIAKTAFGRVKGFVSDLVSGFQGKGVSGLDGFRSGVVTLGDKAQKAGAAIRSGLGDAWAWIKAEAPKVWAAIKDMAGHIKDAVHKIIGYWDDHQKAVGRAVDYIKGVAADLWRIIKVGAGDVQTAIHSIIGYWDDHQKAVGKAVDYIKGVLTDLWQIFKGVFLLIAGVVAVAVLILIDLWDRFGMQLIDHLHTALNAVVEVLKGVFDIIKGVFDVFAAIFTGNWSKAWLGIKEIFGGIWDIIGGVLKLALTAISAAIGAGMAVISAIWDAAVHALEDVWGGAWGAIQWAVSVAWSAVSGIFGAIKAEGLDVLGLAVNGLETVWNAVWGGLSGAVQGAWAMIKPIIDMITGAINAVKGAISALTGGNGGAAAVAAVNATGGQSTAANTALGLAPGFVGLLGGWTPGPVGKAIPNSTVHGGEYMLSNAMLNGSQAIDPYVLGAIGNRGTSTTQFGGPTFPPPTAGGGGGTATTVNQTTVHVHVAGSVAAAADLAATVRTELLKTQRRTGSLSFI